MPKPNIIAISNNLNSIRTTNWKKREDTIFFGLLSQFYKNGQILNEIKIEKYDLIELTNYRLRSNAELKRQLDEFWEHIMMIEVKDEGKRADGMNYYARRQLFTGFYAAWSDDQTQMELTVSLNNDARDLLMEKKEWMKLDYNEYRQISTLKSRALYRLCCKWANLGKFRISLTELMDWMELPASCLEQHNMRKRVFKPFLEECTPFFENLKITSIKTKDRTSKVYAYEITFKPRFVGAYIEGKFDKVATEDKISKAKLRRHELDGRYEELTPKEKRELTELNDWLFKQEKPFVEPLGGESEKMAKERLNDLISRFSSLDPIEKEEFFNLKEWDEKKSFQKDSPFSFEENPFM